MARRDERAAQPVRITSVPASLADDIAARTRRYLVQMSIRVVCFVGAVAVQHWTRWLLLVGAVVLPYVAVILANAGRERRSDPGTYVGPLPPRALPPGGAGGAAPGPSPDRPSGGTPDRPSGGTPDRPSGGTSDRPGGAD